MLQLAASAAARVMTDSICATIQPDAPVKGELALVPLLTLRVLMRCVVANLVHDETVIRTESSGHLLFPR